MKKKYRAAPGTEDQIITVYMSAMSPAEEEQAWRQARDRINKTFFEHQTTSPLFEWLKNAGAKLLMAETAKAIDTKRKQRKVKP